MPNITDKDFITDKDLLLLPPIASELLFMDNDDYLEIMRFNINEKNDPAQPLILPEDTNPKGVVPRLILSEYDCLRDFMLCTLSLKEAEVDSALKEFFSLPLNDMLLYVVERPHAYQTDGVPCPPPEEGPQTWQVILARWRLKMQK